MSLDKQIPQPELSAPTFGVPSSLGTRQKVDWSKSVVKSSLSKRGDDKEVVNTGQKALSVERVNATKSNLVTDNRLRVPSSYLPAFWKSETLRQTLSWATQKAMTTKDVFTNLLKRDDPGSKTTVSKTISPSSTAFRFLDLPPELRLWVYRSALVPSGIVHLEWKPTHRFTGGATLESDHVGEEPNPTFPYAVGLLASCKQINDEIDDLLYAENTFYIDINNLDSSRFPVIMNGDFDEATWALLQHVVLILNAALPGGHSAYRQGYALSDWRPLQHMTGLKSARIIVVTIEDLTEVCHYEILLPHLIERLPATCSIEFGPKTELDCLHAQGLVWAADVERASSRFNYGITVVAEPEALEKAAEGLMEEKGCLSGSAGDHRSFSEDIDAGNMWEW